MTTKRCTTHMRKRRKPLPRIGLSRLHAPMAETTETSETSPPTPSSTARPSSSQRTRRGTSAGLTAGAAWLVGRSRPHDATPRRPLRRLPTADPLRPAVPALHPCPCPPTPHAGRARLRPRVAAPEPCRPRGAAMVRQVRDHARPLRRPRHPRLARRWRPRPLPSLSRPLRRSSRPRGEGVSGQPPSGRGAGRQRNGSPASYTCTTAVFLRGTSRVGFPGRGGADAA